jgi:hypothetical protein
MVEIPVASTKDSNLPLLVISSSVVWKPVLVLGFLVCLNAPWSALTRGCKHFHYVGYLNWEQMRTRPCRKFRWIDFHPQLDDVSVLISDFRYTTER